jgi:hypothetical protein
MRARVSRRQERGDRENAVNNHGAVVPGKSDGKTFGNIVEPAALGERDEVRRLKRHEFPAHHAPGDVPRLVVDLTFLVCDEQDRTLRIAFLPFALYRRGFFH